MTEPTDLKLHEYLSKKAHGKLSEYNILQILDSFKHEGPNGSHWCIVSKLAGPNLDKLARVSKWNLMAKANGEPEVSEEYESDEKKDGKKDEKKDDEDEEEEEDEVNEMINKPLFHFRYTLHIMKQLVKTVKFLHEAGICHAGERCCSSFQKPCHF